MIRNSYKTPSFGRGFHKHRQLGGPVRRIVLPKSGLLAGMPLKETCTLGLASGWSEMTNDRKARIIWLVRFKGIQLEG